MIFGENNLYIVFILGKIGFLPIFTPDVFFRVILSAIIGEIDQMSQIQSDIHSKSIRKIISGVKIGKIPIFPNIKTI